MNKVKPSLPELIADAHRRADLIRRSPRLLRSPRVRAAVVQSVLKQPEQTVKAVNVMGRVVYIAGS